MRGCFRGVFRAGRRRRTLRVLPSGSSAVSRGTTWNPMRGRMVCFFPVAGRPATLSTHPGTCLSPGRRKWILPRRASWRTCVRGKLPHCGGIFPGSVRQAPGTCPGRAAGAGIERTATGKAALQRALSSAAEHTDRSRGDGLDPSARRRRSAHRPIGKRRSEPASEAPASGVGTRAAMHNLPVLQESSGVLLHRT